MPIATVGSLAFAALLFTAVQAALVATYADLGRASETPLVDAARRLGPVVGLVVLVGGVVSIGGFTAGSALGAPRYAQAIASHGLLPRALARVHPRFATPHLAIAATTAVTAALALAFDYRRLVGMSNVAVVMQYVATCLAVPALRAKSPVAPRRGFRVPGGALLPIAGALGSAALLAGTGAEELAFAAGALAAGVVVYVATLARRDGPR